MSKKQKWRHRKHLKEQATETVGQASTPAMSQASSASSTPASTSAATSASVPSVTLSTASKPSFSATVRCSREAEIQQQQAAVSSAVSQQVPAGARQPQAAAPPLNPALQSIVDQAVSCCLDAIFPQQQRGGRKGRGSGPAPARKVGGAWSGMVSQPNPTAAFAQDGCRICGLGGRGGQGRGGRGQGRGGRGWHGFDAGQGYRGFSASDDFDASDSSHI